MATTSKLQVKDATGATVNAAEYAITEDTVTKLLQRVVLANNDGTDQALATQSTLAALYAYFAALNTGADNSTTLLNPVQVGAQTAAMATDNSAGITNTAGYIGRLAMNFNRQLLVQTTHPNIQMPAVVAAFTAGSDVQIIAAPNAGYSLYITDIMISNKTTAGSIYFEADTASAKTKVTSVIWVPVAGNVLLNFAQPIRIPANKNFGYTSVTETDMTLSVNYYIAP